MKALYDSMDNLGDELSALTTVILVDGTEAKLRKLSKLGMYDERGL